jgi:hypothetical protein
MSLPVNPPIPTPHLAGFTGASAAGSVSVPVLQAGDVVQNIVDANGTPMGSDASDYFEPVITVTGQIQQIENTNLAEHLFVALVTRG